MGHQVNITDSNCVFRDTDAVCELAENYPDALYNGWGECDRFERNIDNHSDI